MVAGQHTYRLRKQLTLGQNPDENGRPFVFWVQRV